MHTEGRIGYVWLLVVVGSACVTSSTFAQRHAVIGSVTDSAGVGLERANVVVVAASDSALIAFGITGADGRFAIERLPRGSFVLQVSFVGLKTAFRAFDVVGTDVDVGTLVLELERGELEEFVVTADRLPYVVRGDTIEYNPLAFLVRPQDMVEDLLRRLPGIDVLRSGTIIAHGKVVEHVLVDGKKFFNDDHTIATRNLPADAIDKVQVYDKPSEQAELTGVPDGSEDPTVNLELTEAAKRGAFGQTTGGLGVATRQDQGRYFSRVSGFRFAPKTQLALIGNAENVHQPGFSVAQLRSFQGAGSIMSADDGISESLGAGLNLNREFRGGSTVNFSYFLTDHTNTREASLVRQELFGTNLSALREEANSRRAGDLSHSATLQADVELGEAHDVRLEGTLVRTFSSRHRTSTELTENSVGMRLNDAVSSDANDGDNLGGNAHLTWRKRISPGGRSLVITNSLEASDADAANSLFAETRLYRVGDLQTRDELHQLQEAQNSSLTYRHQFKFLQPLSSNQTLSVFVRRAVTERQQDRVYYDILDGHSILNTMLSEEYGQRYEYWRSGVDVSLRSHEPGIWWVWTEIEAQHSNRRGRTGGLDQSIRSRYTHLVTSLILQRDLGSIGHVEVAFGTQAREPSLAQLQPFTDNTRPLRIYRGNPALRREIRYDFWIRHSLSQGYPKRSLRASIRSVLTRNSIVQNRAVDAHLRATVHPINAGDVWSVDGDVAYSRTIVPLGVEWSLRYDVDAEMGLDFINGEENISRLLRHRPRLELDHYGDTFGFTARASVSFNRLRNSLSDELDRSFTNGTVDMEAFWNPTSTWSLETSLMYRSLDRNLFGKGQDLALVGFKVARLFFEGRGILELEFHDILNHSRRVAITTAANYVQESRVRTLGGYVMVKFTYKPRLM